MAVHGIGFVGMRSDRLDEMVKLFGDVIGVPPERQTGNLPGFRLADGTVLELCGSGDGYHAFFKTGPVVGFRVDDLEATRLKMVEAGIGFIGEVQSADGKSWQHFYCPDGTVAEIIGPHVRPPGK